MKKSLWTLMVLIFLMTSSLGVMAATDGSTQVLPVITATKGETIQYDLYLQNNQSSVMTLNLVTDNLINAYHPQMLKDGYPLDTFTIEAGMGGIMTLALTIPDNQPIGETLLAITLVDQKGINHGSQLWISVNNDYCLVQSNQISNLSATSGKSFTLQLDVTNTGALVQDQIVPAFDLPSKWVVESVSPATMTLNQGETGSFQVQIYVPPTQSSGSNHLDVTMTSPYTTSYAETIPVNVTSSSSYGLFAIVLIIVAALGTLIYFKKHGRR